MLKIYDKHRRSIPAGIPSPKVSLFENMTSVVPIEEISLGIFIKLGLPRHRAYLSGNAGSGGPQRDKEVPPPLCDRFLNIRYTSPKKARASA